MGILWAMHVDQVCKIPILQISPSALLLDSPACGFCHQVTDTASWTIQQQCWKRNFEGTSKLPAAQYLHMLAKFDMGM